MQRSTMLSRLDGTTFSEVDNECLSAGLVWILPDVQKRNVFPQKLSKSTLKSPPTHPESKLIPLIPSLGGVPSVLRGSAGVFLLPVSLTTSRWIWALVISITSHFSNQIDLVWNRGGGCPLLTLFQRQMFWETRWDNTVKVRCYPETSLFSVQGVRMKRCQSDFDPGGRAASYHFYFIAAVQTENIGTPKV